MSDEGVALADAPVWVESAELGQSAIDFTDHRVPLLKTRTDAAGRFEFASVPVGAHCIGMGPTRGERTDDWLAIGRRVLVPVGGVELELRAERGEAIRGVVVDIGGGPAKNASVTLVGASPQLSRMCRTEQDGSFVVAGLPDAQYELRAALAGCPCSADPALARTGDIGVLLQLQRAAPLRLIALDSDRRPLDIREVLITPASGGLVVAHAAPANHGRFVLPEAPAGVVHVAIRSRGGEFGVLHDFRPSDDPDAWTEVEACETGAVRIENGSSLHAVEALVRTEAGAVLAVLRLDPGEARALKAPLGALQVSFETGRSDERTVEIACVRGKENSIALPDADERTRQD